MTEREKFEAKFPVPRELRWNGVDEYVSDAIHYMQMAKEYTNWLRVWQARAAQDEWISVEDKPLLNKKVLLIDGSKRVWTGKRIGADHYVLSNMDYSDKVHWQYFTHWKPLPEGPKS